jgi:hypothetical protein
LTELVKSRDSTKGNRPLTRFPQAELPAYLNGEIDAEAVIEDSQAGKETAKSHKSLISKIAPVAQ